MSPIREQGTYMFLPAITYFQFHVYFRDNKNLCELGKIMQESTNKEGGKKEERESNGRKSSEDGGRRDLS